jgi:hypothetical protein
MGDTEEFSSMPYIRDFSIAPSPISKKDLTEPGDFVPRFFWSLRNRFGQARTDVLLWKALKRLNPKSGLLDLPAAILEAAGDRTFAPDEVEELKARMVRLFRVPSSRRGD